MDQYHCSTSWWGLFLFWGRIKVSSSYSQWKLAMTGIRTQALTVVNPSALPLRLSYPATHQLIPNVQVILNHNKKLTYFSFYCSRWPVRRPIARPEDCSRAEGARNYVRSSYSQWSSIPAQSLEVPAQSLWFLLVDCANSTISSIHSFQIVMHRFLIISPSLLWESSSV